MTQLSATNSEDRYLLSNTQAANRTRIEQLDETLEKTSRENRRLHAEIRILWDLLFFDCSEDPNEP